MSDGVLANLGLLQNVDNSEMVKVEQFFMVSLLSVIDFQISEVRGGGDMPSENPFIAYATTMMMAAATRMTQVRTTTWDLLFMIVVVARFIFFQIYVTNIFLILFILFPV